MLITKHATPAKIKIAVRMPDKSRRMYVVDDAGMTPDEMRAATLAEVPTAAVVLIGLLLPPPVAPLTELDVA